MRRGRNVANILLHSYDVDAALEALAPVRAAAVEAGEDFVVADVDIKICNVLEAGQRHEELLVAAEIAIESAGRAGLGRWTRPTLRFALAFSHLKLGQLREALEQVDLALADVADRSESRAPPSRCSVRFDVDGGISIRSRSPGGVPNPRRHARGGARRGGLATGRAQLAFAERRLADVERIVTATAPLVVGLKAYDSMSETAWKLAEVGLSAAAELMEIATAADDVVAQERIRATVPVMTGYVEDVRRQRDSAGVPPQDWTDELRGTHRRSCRSNRGSRRPALWQAAADRFTPRSIEGLTARYRQAEAMLAARAPRDEVRGVMAVRHTGAVESGCPAPGALASKSWPGVPGST